MRNTYVSGCAGILRLTIVIYGHHVETDILPYDLLNTVSALLEPPGDIFWAHFGHFRRKIGQKYGNFRRFFAEIDHSAWPENPKN